MNPIKLLRETDQVPVAIACGKCGQHWSLVWDRAETEALRCCDPVAKEAAQDKAHREFEERCAKQDADRVAKAKRIPESEYTGAMIYCEGYGYQEGYLNGFEELRDYCDGDERPLPDFVWATSPVPFRLKSAADFIQDECENGDYHEDIEGDVVGDKELQEAINAFNDAQTACSYHVDYSTLIEVAPMEVTNG